MAVGGHWMLHQSAGAQAELHVSVPPLVEVIRENQIVLDCAPREQPEHYVMEWFLVSALRWKPGRKRREGEGGSSGLAALAAISSTYTDRLLRRRGAIRSCLPTSQMRRLRPRKALACAGCQEHAQGRREDAFPFGT